MSADDDGSIRLHRGLAYGAGEDQLGDLWLPVGVAPEAGWPVAVLLHGGFWREHYRRDLMDPVAADLARRGWAVWNLEYRRVRGAGGWPRTFDDVAAGIDHLRGLSRPTGGPGTRPPAADAGARRTSPQAPIDLGEVVVLGHSAGGHLALWVVGRGLLPDAAPGARPLVRPARVVALAPVADLRAADAAGLSDGAVRELLGGGPDEQPERWRLADPVALVGHGIPVLLVHGEYDEDVPPTQSVSYRAAAERAGDAVTLVTGPWDHMGPIDPASPGWQAALPFFARPSDGLGVPPRDPVPAAHPDRPRIR